MVDPPPPSHAARAPLKPLVGVQAAVPATVIAMQGIRGRARVRAGMVVLVVVVVEAAVGPCDDRCVRSGVETTVFMSGAATIGAFTAILRRSVRSKRC